MSTKSDLMTCLRNKTSGEPEVQKILVDKLLAEVPDDEGRQLLTTALRVYTAGVKPTSLEFVGPSTTLSTGGNYDYTNNKIKVARTTDHVDMAHSVLFETYNAARKQQFLNADRQFLNANQTALDYGNLKAQIEAGTLADYIRLTRLIRKTYQKMPLSKFATYQLGACMGCKTGNDFLVVTKMTAHKATARDQQSMMTPKMYAYEKIMLLGVGDAKRKMKQTVSASCRTNQNMAGLFDFAMWFGVCWKDAAQATRPKMWLVGGEEASSAFARELRNRKITHRELGFAGPMAAMAEKLAGGWHPTAFQGHRFYPDFQRARGH